MRLWRPKTSMCEKRKIVMKISTLLKLWLTINQSVDLYNRQHKNQWMSKCTIYSWYKRDNWIKTLIDWFKEFFEKHKKIRIENHHKN